MAEQLVALRSQLALDLRIHARYELSRPLGAAAVRQALSQGWVDLLSFMDHTPGQGQFRTPEDYIRYMARQLARPSEEVAASLAAKAGRRPCRALPNWLSKRKLWGYLWLPTTTTAPPRFS